MRYACIAMVPLLHHGTYYIGWLVGGFGCAVVVVVLGGARPLLVSPWCYTVISCEQALRYDAGLAVPVLMS